MRIEPRCCATSPRPPTPTGCESNGRRTSRFQIWFFLRPSDGTEIGRLRFFEPERRDPFMRTIILKEVTWAEQEQLETHLAAGLLPLVTRVFSYPLWMNLAD